MEPIFLHSIARVLVLLHAVSAMVLVGASTHATVVTIGTIRGRAREKLARIYASVVAIAYLTTMIFGALAYPTYRYRVRGLYFDRYAVWASNLFDIKENLATLGLPLVMGALVLRLSISLETERRVLPAYAFLVVTSTAIIWFDVLSELPRHVRAGNLNGTRCPTVSRSLHRCRRV